MFYDRSLGAIGNDGYRLTSASQPKTGKQPHTVDAAYDAAGYMRRMTVTRPETLCAVDKSCPVQTYEYQWDEVGRLTKAARKDGAVQAAELTYAYDASDNRVRKSVKVGEDWRHTIYVFGSLELRSTDFTESGYTVNDSTEVPYLFGHGVRLARVTYIGATAFTDERRRVFLELGDHLGSTSVVMDRATGELVERSTAYAYGAAESNYRPGEWYEFREDYRFTGKEDDIEVGLIYFGARYLNPQLGRWISADPLAVHAPGRSLRQGRGQGPAGNEANQNGVEDAEGPEVDLNEYAYVSGRTNIRVDPQGLWSSKSIVIPSLGIYGQPTRTVIAEPVHQMAIEKVLGPKLTSVQVSILKRQQVIDDELQDPDHQPMHAMNGNGMNRSEAIARTNSIVRESLVYAKREQGAGNELGAYQRLGTAIHALQDATSPSHRGFQEYHGGPPWLEAAGHAVPELHYPGQGTREARELEGVTRWAHDIFVGAAPMPERFFDAESGALLLPEKYKSGSTEGRTTPPPAEGQGSQQPEK